MIGATRLPRLLDVERVQRAIADAETLTSGQIRVSVAPFFWGNVRRAAERAFVRLGMTLTRHRNGVLFFIVPSRRSFVVLGDAGIHARLGDERWDRIVREMEPFFRQKEFTAGVLFGIENVGRLLAEHFPPDEAGGNELPDAVDVGAP